jgi:hypothetical protein
MAPQFGPDGPDGHACITDDSFPSCNTSNTTTTTTTSHIKQLNIPLLALGLGLAGFLLICLTVCACTYRNAKARNRATRHLVPKEMARGEYVGLGLGLRDCPTVIIFKILDKETNNDGGAPPAYSPKPSPSRSPQRLQQAPSSLTPGAGFSSPSPLLSLSPSPALALAAPVSPALSSYTLSPALSQGDNEEAGLLGGSRALTPPPPTYVR